MICRIAVHEQTPDSITSVDAKAFRDWVKGHPGFIGGYHAQDSETGRAASITVWDSRESMLALTYHTPPGGPMGMMPVLVEFFDVVEQF